MTEYAKSTVDSVVSVTSIATVLQADLRNRITGTEYHDFPEIFCMAQGQGCVTVNGTQLSLHAGQMIVYGANSNHGEATGGIAEIIGFETALPLPAEFCDRVITLSGSQRVLLHEIIEQARPMFETRVGIKGMVLKKHADQYAVQRTKNKLELFLLGIIGPSEHHQQDEINILTDYIVENIHRVLTLQEMSKELGMSVSSLKRLVKEKYSTSPIAYVTDLKMEEAKRLILHSSMNMTEIAGKLGFSSVHYFSKVFKQKIGKTPSEYRTEFS